MQGEGVESGVGVAGHGGDPSCLELPGIVGYILYDPSAASGGPKETAMKVSDILRVKGNTLYTVGPDEPLAYAIDAMADIHASADYRQHLAAVLSRRALEKAAGLADNAPWNRAH